MEYNKVNIEYEINIKGTPTPLEQDINPIYINTSAKKLKEGGIAAFAATAIHHQKARAGAAWIIPRFTRSERLCVLS